MGVMSKGVANTLLPAKKYRQKIAKMKKMGKKYVTTNNFNTGS
jgi:hypothetical protein